MPDQTTLMADVVGLLQAEGVQILPIPKSEAAPPPIVVAFFEVEGQRMPVLVATDDAREYFQLIGMVISPSGEVPPPVKLDSLPAETLRTIIRLQSQVPLAKAQFTEVEGRGTWIAISQCSTREMTGIKMRRRLEDCARLAQKLSRVLAPAPSTTPATP